MNKFILFTILLFTACSSASESYGDDDNKYIGNPYSESSGHHAGYEWAERTGGACDGNSASFNEGCEEYYNQTDY